VDERTGEYSGASADDEPEQAAAQPKKSPGSKRTSRRRLLGRGATAAAGGFAAALYVKPNLKELGVPRSYAAVSPGMGNPPSPPPWNPPDLDDLWDWFRDWIRRRRG
jgi:hypothetical protein